MINSVFPDKIPKGWYTTTINGTTKLVFKYTHLKGDEEVPSLNVFHVNDEKLRFMRVIDLPEGTILIPIVFAGNGPPLQLIFDKEKA